MIRLSVNSIHNIVVVGETSAGKSSLINLVTGKDSAVTADDVRGVTTKADVYDWINDDQTFRLWDTPGLRERTYVSSKRAQDTIQSLLTELCKGDGVHLLVLCMHGLPKVTEGMKRTYDAILRIRDKTNPDVPLVAIITNLERESAVPDILSSMDEWWTDNVAALSSFDMVFCGHACITTLPDNCLPKLPGRRELCQGLVRHVIVEGVSPKLARNIVIAGEIGVGKSSLVNLVLDSEQAVVADDDSPMTTATSYYDWKTNNQIFRLWDTPGLREEPDGEEVLQPLFLDLNKKGGIHLLINCISGMTRIMAAKKTHDLIVRMRDKFSPMTPVVAIITGVERLSNASNALVSMEEWWKANSGRLYDLDIFFSGHACITTLPDDRHPQLPGRRELCRGLVRNLVVNRSFPLQVVSSKGNDLNILLLGEIGVGKSSLVNLLVGWQIASVSQDGSTPWTMDSYDYRFSLGSTTICLWDTAGFPEPERDLNSHAGAVEKAAELVQRLNATVGISLFLFCVRGDGITPSMQSNYRSFYEDLGKKEVPIALVVNHLEEEADMEDWWRRNNQMLENKDMFFAGHACITSLEGHPKYAGSRKNLQGLLSDIDDRRPGDWWIDERFGPDSSNCIFLPIFS